MTQPLSHQSINLTLRTQLADAALALANALVEHQWSVKHTPANAHPQLQALVQQAQQQAKQRADELLALAKQAAQQYQAD